MNQAMVSPFEDLPFLPSSTLVTNEPNLSVINTDRMDRRKYRDMVEYSPNLLAKEEEGKAILPSFDSLQGDIWASLFKMSPRMKADEDIDPSVVIHKVLMERVMKDDQFDRIRQYSRLQDVTSALATIHLSNQTQLWLKEKMDQATKQMMKDYQKSIQQATELQRQAQKAQEKAEQSSQDGSPSVGQDLANAQKAKQRADQAQQQSDQLGNQLAQMIQALLKKEKGRPGGFSAYMEKACESTKQSRDQLQALLGSGCGTDDAEMNKVPLRDQLQLAEALLKSQKLAEIVMWAGRFKEIAKKKQKTKHADSVDRSGVTMGNKIPQLLPVEFLHMQNPLTKLDFYRRFAEGHTLMFDTSGKETLGKGPIIFCLDQSTSMVGLDTQSKGFALAMMMIAKMQKRDFALVCFSNGARLKTSIYEKGNLQPQDFIEMAESFLKGGTDFELPLKEAARIIGTSRFRKADITFCTDGVSSVSNGFLKEFLKIKKEKEFQILSILIGEFTNEEAVSRFSDKIVKADDFTDEGLMEKAFSI